MMHRYEVGKPHNPDQPNRTYPEGFHLNYMDGDISVIAYMDQPTAGEIRDFKSGVPQFALVEGKSCLVLCIRMGTQPWSDAPWEAWRQQTGRGLPEPGANLLTVLLCDARGGIVRNIRVIGLNTDFAQALHRVVARLTAEGAAPETASAELKGFMASTPTELVARAQHRA